MQELPEGNEGTSSQGAGDGRRLDDSAAGGFLLVTKVTPTEEQRLRLVEHGTRLLEIDPASEVGTWLSDGRSVAALVRPDHTVMQAGQDLAALVLAAPRFRPVGDAGPSGPDGV